MKIEFISESKTHYYAIEEVRELRQKVEIVVTRERIVKNLDELGLYAEPLSDFHKTGRARKFG